MGRESRANYVSILVQNRRRPIDEARVQVVQSEARDSYEAGSRCPALLLDAGVCIWSLGFNIQIVNLLRTH